MRNVPSELIRNYKRLKKQSIKNQIKINESTIKMKDL